MLPHFPANQWQFPHSVFGCLVPCCQFMWTQLLRAAVPRVILLRPTLKHFQCTEKSLGAGIKIYESLKTEFPVSQGTLDSFEWLSWELQKGVARI